MIDLDECAKIHQTQTVEKVQETAPVEKKSLEILLANFKNDITTYPLTPPSHGFEQKDYPNYDSLFFTEVDVEVEVGVPAPTVSNVGIETGKCMGAETHKQSKSAQNSPRSQEDINKRIMTFHKKCIARWAESKENIERVLRWQNENVDPDEIFGTMSSDCVNLADIVGSHRTFKQRGSSANWRNETWTPATQHKLRPKVQPPVPEFQCPNQVQLITRLEANQVEDSYCQDFPYDEHDLTEKSDIHVPVIH